MISLKQELRKARVFFHERTSHRVGFKDKGMKILKQGIIIGGVVARSLIGIGAAATLFYAALRKRKKSGDKKESIG
jgi:hypothetical protein